MMKYLILTYKLGVVGECAGKETTLGKVQDFTAATGTHRTYKNRNTGTQQ